MARLDWTKTKTYIDDEITTALGRPTSLKFPAKFAGWCSTCETNYPEGTVITKDKVTGKYMHARCKR
jgi:hypothetical protein